MITFFVMAAVCSIVGFGGLAGQFIGIAKFLGMLFLVCFVVSSVFSFARRPKI